MANSNRPVPYEITEKDTVQLREFAANGDGFRVISAKDFPSFLPVDLTAKFDSATVIVSGSRTPTEVVLFNFQRIDGDEVDQHPYGAVLVSGSVAVSSSFIEHGDWPGRTTKITDEHAKHIIASGVRDYLYMHPPHGVRSGPLDELPKSDVGAFEEYIRYAMGPE